ncbi:MAG: glycosyltransferase [Eubacterium sp.]|nr:glycosyltransferase [Eubacterium sp.]
MSQLLYVKYNTLRKPEYQVETQIVSKATEKDGSEKMVLKLPSCEAAKDHIITIRENFDKLKSYYKGIKVIPSSSYRDGLAFVFLKGKPITEGIDFAKDDIDDIVSKVQKLLDKILDVKDEFRADFEMTEEFEEYFPGCDPVASGAAQGAAIPAFTRVNLDSILSNFIITNMGWVCLDYEWVLDFPVPADFLKYRILVYLYNDVAAELSQRIEITDFLAKFGLCDDFSSDSDAEADDSESVNSILALYEKMDNIFQDKVHGENRQYSYLSRYEKKVQTVGAKLAEMQREVDYDKKLVEEKETHIANITAKHELIEQDLKDEIAELNKITYYQETAISEKDEYIAGLEQHSQALEAKVAHIRRCLTNPFYGIYAAFKFGPGAIKRTIVRKKEAKEEARRLAEKQARDDAREKELAAQTVKDYQAWIEKVESTYSFAATFEYKPLISVVMPVYNMPDKYLIPAIESVRSQSYTNWELILVDDASDMPSVAKTLKKYDRKGDNIKVIFRESNGRISACTNTGIEEATGEFIAFMDCDDTLAPFALYEVVKELNRDIYLDFIYSDEDKINDDGTVRHSAFFKPDWSPDTLMSYMYTSHLGVYRTSLVKELEGLKSEYDGCQDYDFTMRVAEKTDKIAHVAKILYHWREREGSTALNPEAKDYVKEATLKAKQAALERRGVTADVEWIPEIFQYRINYRPLDNPLVSIIIPSKDNPAILTQCLESLTKITNYRNYEIIVVDNGSNEENREKYQELLNGIKKKDISTKYLYAPRDFNFSFMCNIGAKSSSGEYLLFLNDDIEIIEPEWLERMLGQAELPHVGAVGAKLLYPETTLIQHDGVISIESGPVHYFTKQDDTTNYYFNRNRLDFNVSAVTAACLLVKKTRFERVSGFDEELAVAYNDIDLCYRLSEQKLYNVIRNDAVLYHHESISRGDDTMDDAKFERLMSEQEKLYDSHPRFKKKDPYYSCNLSQVASDFSYNIDFDAEYSVETYDTLENYEVDETINYGIDNVVHDWCFYVEGWAFRRGEEDNQYVDPKVVLEPVNIEVAETAEFETEVVEEVETEVIDAETEVVEAVESEVVDESEVEVIGEAEVIDSEVVGEVVEVIDEESTDDTTDVLAKKDAEQSDEHTDVLAKTESDEHTDVLAKIKTDNKVVDKTEDNNSVVHESRTIETKAGEKIYIISTRHVEREDVAETFPDDEHIEYAGFKLRVARKAVPSGEYRVRILVNNKISPLKDDDIQETISI